jgi:hypothetical protein
MNNKTPGAIVETDSSNGRELFVPTCTAHERTWHGPSSYDKQIAQANALLHNEQHKIPTPADVAKAASKKRVNL